jgi:hypothetical protein
MKLNPGLKTGREGRRLETQKQQREAMGKGLHPRGLARSVAKGLNVMHGQKESEIGRWRETVAKMPRTGRKRIYPKK